MGHISYQVTPADQKLGVKGYLDSVWKCSYENCDRLTNCLFRAKDRRTLVRACCQEHANFKEVDF